MTGKLPTWDGTRFDLPWAIAVLYRGPVVPKNPDRKDECFRSTGPASRIARR